MERLCPVCGEPLSQTRRKFCSDKCGAYVRRAKYNAKEKAVGPDKPAPRFEKKKVKGVTLDKVIQGMIKTGLQYGDYVNKYGV